MPEVPYKYFMTVSPLDGKLYISDYQSRTILRVKTMGAVRDLKQNMEIIAGTGDQCVPGDRNKCGDGGPAKQAKLFYPKGIQKEYYLESYENTLYIVSDLFRPIDFHLCLIFYYQFFCQLFHSMLSPILNCIACVIVRYCNQQRCYGLFCRWSKH